MESIMLLLDEMEGYLQECNNLPFSSRVVVNMEVLYEFMADLRMKLPEEVKRSKRIIDERDKTIGLANQQADSVLGDAETRANAMLKEAEEMAAKMVDEHEIRKQAIKEAEELMQQARSAAEEITGGSYDYVDKLLAQNQQVLNDLLANSHQQFLQYEDYLKSQLQVLNQNRNSIKREE